MTAPQTGAQALRDALGNTTVLAVRGVPDPVMDIMAFEVIETLAAAGYSVVRTS